jgi:hypothetical protein
MRAHALAAALAIVGAFAPALAFAGDIEWRRYVIPSTGTSVDMPVSIFTSDAGAPEGGTGRRFFTEDRRADLTVQSVANPTTIRPPRSWPSSGRLPASSTNGSHLISLSCPAFATTGSGTTAATAATAP